MAATKSKFKTGFCSNGQHEGTKPKSTSGKPLKTCEFWDTCICSCHETITQMYVLTGMDREPPEQSVDYFEWVRSERRQFAMPSPFNSDPLAVPSTDPGTDAPPNYEGPSTGQQDPVRATPAPPAPVPAGPTFGPTPTGRRARGQLEYDVLQVCDEFSRNVYEWGYCTPKNVADRIAVMNQAEAPSTGAINAVWDRWEKLGYIEQAKKPSRFVAFTEGLDGSVQALAALKLRAKRSRKKVSAEMARGSLRPRGKK